MNKMHRVFPTLDMFIDVDAKNDDDAISIVDTNNEVRKIIDECCSQLSQLGYQEGGCDKTYVTDRFKKD